MNNAKFARPEDFETPQIVTFGFAQYVSAAEVGARYADRKGNTNRVLLRLQSGEEVMLQSTSYGLTKAFKDAKLNPGDEAIVLSVSLKDPYSDRTFRHWVVQRVQNMGNGVVQYGPQPAQRPVANPYPQQANDPDPWDAPATGTFGAPVDGNMGTEIDW